MNSCTSSQNRAVRKHATILSSSLDTIEACGGGSAMMAEVFLLKEKKRPSLLKVFFLNITFWFSTSDLFYYC
jgi:hypothetical protein